MSELLILAALVSVLGPFALAISVSELGKVRQNRAEARRAHSRIDQLVEESLLPEEREILRQQEQAQAARDDAVRSLYEYGGC